MSVPGDQGSGRVAESPAPLVTRVTPPSRANPYRMAAIQGRVVEVRPDEGCRYMDPISIKYTSAPFPSRGPDRVCFVIAVEKAAARALGFAHHPTADGQQIEHADTAGSQGVPPV